MAPRVSSTANHSGLVAGAHARNDPTLDSFGIAASGAGHAYREKTPSVQSAEDDCKNSTSGSRLTKTRELEDFAYKQISDYNGRQNQQHRSHNHIQPNHRSHNHSTDRNNRAQTTKKETQDNLFNTSLPPLSQEARDQRSRRHDAVLGANRPRHNSAVHGEGALDIFMHNLTVKEADPETNRIVAEAGRGGRDRELWRERLTGAGVGIPGFR